MSVNDFKKRPRLNISVTVNCFGKFDPFTGFGKLDWSLSGSIAAQTGAPNVTVREITCQQPTNPDSIFGFFEIQGSTGNTSGTIDVGILPETFSGISKGEWKVNTEPVLEEFGMVGGVPGDRINYYVVALPTTVGATIDTPITITPQIDQLKRVYPGDFVSIDRQFGTQRWYVYPQRRLPKPDRTFFWAPNETPVLASGGMVDGKLAKPGTIMIPTATKWLDLDKLIDGIQYIHAGVGILFDGQKWVSNVSAVVANPGEENESFWPEASYISDQLYEARLESDHRFKHLINTNTRQPAGAFFNFVYTIGSEEYSTNAYFEWISTFMGISGNFQAASIFYDRGDAYSHNYKKKKEWYKSKNKPFNPAIGKITVFNWNPETPVASFNVSCYAFEDGNQTEYEEIGYDFDGSELINNFTMIIGVQTTVP